MLPIWFTIPEQASGPIVEPGLTQALNASDDTPLRIIVILERERNIQAMMVDSGEVVGYAKARANLVSTMREDLDRAVAPLAPLLNDAEAQGQILARRDLWIINGLALTAHPEVVRALMNSPEVAEVRLDHVHQYVDPDFDIRSFPQSGQAMTADLPWGIKQIRAPEVWRGLKITGTHAIVANMDTGVEFMHPALFANYRGNLGRGLLEHSKSWFDPINGSIYPHDDHGHGSHTMGTAVGRGGQETSDSIGVAPGARWIAVKAFSGAGIGYDSWIHAGFQWLLAPGGDPALAPDVVNCSWGSSNSRKMEFQDDIAALEASGIFVVFSAGNDGPRTSSVGSPASLPGVFAVGASDPDDEVASFSSRGPTPWQEIKPYVVAPGAIVESAIPGGIYGKKNGTSMAAPHVTGLVALMRSVSPTIKIRTLANTIKSTAQPLGTSVPNNNSGWGRIDALAALVKTTRPGQLTGAIRGLAGKPLANATVLATSYKPTGGFIKATTDLSGTYHLVLKPGLYDVKVTAFGYESRTQTQIRTITNTVDHMNFTLPPLPAGIVKGRITVLQTGEAPTRPVTLEVLESPARITPDQQGYYEVALPVGTYTVKVAGNGYRTTQATITVSTSETANYDFLLQRHPTLLLVDGDAWNYSGQLSYWRQALEELKYAYDEWSVKHIPEDVPSIETMLTYDIVLWSAPKSSPGLAHSGQVLQEYLKQGGRLWVSGQDVAFYDAGNPSYMFQPYLYNQTGAHYLGDNSNSRQLTGLGPFEGLTVTITGGDGANNQVYPDVIGIRRPELASRTWQYAEDAAGGVEASICVPYRSLFFSFGFEAIASAAMRRTVMNRALTWLNASPPETGLRLSATEATLTGAPGERVTHTLYLRHVGMAGPPDTVAIKISGQQWRTTVTPSVVTVDPCQMITITVNVTIPDTTGINESDTVDLRIRSSLLPSGPSAILRTKTPAPVLLVDDDRWYQMESYYREALEARDIPYDIWSTRHHESGPPGAYSPYTDTLQHYPIVLWFTGYDWYEPIRDEEKSRLLTYLDEGGRLLLSSLEFLYKHSDEPLACRFGVLSYNEILNPTQASGVPDHPAGGLWGPVKLFYPYQNWADAIEPRPEAAPIVRGGKGQPLAVAAGSTVSLAASCNISLTEHTWRTLFYGFPIETLPLDTRAEALERAVGWLSPLGQSHWTITPTVLAAAPGYPTIAQPNARVTATLILRNDADDQVSTVISHTLPPFLTLIAGTLPAGVTYNASTRHIHWSGNIPPDQPLTLSWAMGLSPEAPAGLRLDPVIEFTMPDLGGITFSREAPLRVGGANLATSDWLLEDPEHSKVTFVPGKPVTLTFALRNTGPDALQMGNVQVWIIRGLGVVTATKFPSIGTQVMLWEGGLPAETTRTLTIPLRSWYKFNPLRVDALIEDTVTYQRWERRLWLTEKIWRYYLPVVLRAPTTQADE
jgi:subtilisin family serine protease